MKKVILKTLLRPGTKSTTAVYQLGKIKNKYIILDIMGFIDFREDAAPYIHGVSFMFRALMFRNHRAYSMKVFEK